ncbi:hypothetical protein Pelo_3453 [Pelomyxa schiedti]|nr:hypothetical protein Pelo_3453 [Pelomyxa schiedti]
MNSCGRDDLGLSVPREEDALLVLGDTLCWLLHALRCRCSGGCRALAPDLPPLPPSVYDLLPPNADPDAASSSSNSNSNDALRREMPAVVHHVLCVHGVTREVASRLKMSPECAKLRPPSLMRGHLMRRQTQSESQSQSQSQSQVQVQMRNPYIQIEEKTVDTKSVLLEPYSRRWLLLVAQLINIIDPTLPHRLMEVSGGSSLVAIQHSLVMLGSKLPSKNSSTTEHLTFLIELASFALYCLSSLHSPQSLHQSSFAHTAVLDAALESSSLFSTDCQIPKTNRPPPTHMSDQFSPVEYNPLPSQQQYHRTISTLINTGSTSCYIPTLKESARAIATQQVTQLGGIEDVAQLMEKHNTLVCGLVDKLGYLSNLCNQLRSQLSIPVETPPTSQLFQQHQLLERLAGGRNTL